MNLILFNKPYGVLSQFRADNGIPTLADYIDQPGFYPAGRLDKDSEGLLLLTNEGDLQARIADPRYKLAKTYWIQVEGIVHDAALQDLRRGVTLRDGPTRPAQVRRMQSADLPERVPPIRVRKQIPTNWLEITLREGRNRQVRRMSAAVGHPTLRLYRHSIDNWTTEGISPGQWQMKQINLPSRRRR